MSEDLYLDHILDHAESPRGVGHLKKPTHSASHTNPVCGDQLSVDLLVDSSGVIKQVAWQGEGCIISQAAASLLTELIEGKSLAEVTGWTDDRVLDKLGLPEIAYTRRECALGFWRTVLLGVKWRQDRPTATSPQGGRS